VFSVFGGPAQHSQLSTHNRSQGSVAHLRSQRVCASGDEFKASSATAVRALRSNGFIVEHLILISFQPHELETLWAGSDLR
jgi:hypothetical protein